jgi:hypothetical protein
MCSHRDNAATGATRRIKTGKLRARSNAHSEIYILDGAHWTDFDLAE